MKPRLIKRVRRTREGMNDVLLAAQQIIDGENDRITLRHLFYRLVGVGAIEKTDKAYKSLCQQSMKWRRVGDITWDSFADSTRFYRGAALYESVQEALQELQDTYRKNLWADQDDHVEIWCEKDAIAEVLAGEARKYGVRVLALRGFPSATQLHESAQDFKKFDHQGKQVFLFYFGDHDPSGKDIDRQLQAALWQDHQVSVEFERLAVNEEDIDELHLLTRPVKAGDTRAKDWEGRCVEVDSMPMQVLRDRVRSAILDRIDVPKWQKLQEVEQAEGAVIAKAIKAAAPPPK